MFMRCPLREEIKRASVASPRFPIMLYKYNKHHFPDVKGSAYFILKLLRCGLDCRLTTWVLSVNSWRLQFVTLWQYDRKTN